VDAWNRSKREPNYPPRDSPANKLGEARWGLFCRGLIYSMAHVLPLLNPPQIGEEAVGGHSELVKTRARSSAP